MQGEDLTMEEYTKFCKGVIKIKDLEKNITRSSAGYLIDYD